VVERRDENGGADSDPLRTGGDRRGHRQRLREIAVVEQVMLGHPDGVDAEPVGLFAHLQRESVETAPVDLPLRRISQVEVQTDVHRHSTSIGISLII
jgi:hypothetical protein